MARYSSNKAVHPVIGYIMGISFMLMGTAITVSQYPDGETQFITGMVTGVGDCSTSSKGGTTCKGNFEYTMYGITYRGSTGYSTGFKWKRGETITVIASKDNPDDYTTLKDIMFGILIAIAGLFLICSFTFSTIYQKRVRNPQFQANPWNTYHMQNNEWDKNNIQNHNRNRNNKQNNGWDRNNKQNNGWDRNQ